MFFLNRNGRYLRPRFHLGLSPTLYPRQIVLEAATRQADGGGAIFQISVFLLPHDSGRFWSAASVAPCQWLSVSEKLIQNDSIENNQGHKTLLILALYSATNNEPSNVYHHARGFSLMNDQSQSPNGAYSPVTTPSEVQDLTGSVFGKWTVVSYSHKQEKKGTRGARHCWLCKCSCERQTLKPIAQIYLINGESKSCGCWRGEFAVKHGMSWGENRHQLYSTWNSMRHRCTSPASREITIDMAGAELK